VRNNGAAYAIGCVSVCLAGIDVDILRLNAYLVPTSS